jgi:hypothetical protein
MDIRSKQHMPFPWIYNIDWSSILQHESSSCQLTPWNPPSATNIEAVLYQAPKDSILPLFFTALLVNNMAHLEHLPLHDAYQWLKSLPPSALTQIMGSLPDPILEALKERVYVDAIEAGDENVVQSMLALNVDSWEKVNRNRNIHPRVSHPLRLAISGGHYAVACLIVKQMCQGSSSSHKNEVLDMIIDSDRGEPRDSSTSNEGLLTNSEVVDLLCIVLSEGARRDVRCITAARGEFDLVKRLLRSGTGDISAWILVGLLETCIRDAQNHPDNKLAVLAERVMLYVLDVNNIDLPIGDEVFKSSLLQGLRCAIASRHLWATDLILGAFTQLRYHLDANSDTKGASISVLNQACRTADWELALSLLPQLKNRGVDVIRESDRAHLQSHDGVLKPAERLYQAIDQNDVELASHLLDSNDLKGVQDDLELLGAIEKAVGLGHDRMATEVLHRLENVRTRWQGAVSLLKRGRTATISALLLKNSEWNMSLDTAAKHNDFRALEDMLYENIDTMSYSACSDDTEAVSGQQICLRVLAYHAIETNNFRLYKWLLELGLDSDELIYICGKCDRVFLSKRPGMNGGLLKAVQQENRSIGVFPSILALAAEQNSVPWMKFLLEEGADCKDSMALLRAVQSKAKVTTVRLLLERADSHRHYDKRIYGSASLREAIRHRDISMVNMLCDIVDIDGTESSTEELLENELIFTSPLGEAIRQRDIAMIRILLDRGAGVNSIVSYNRWTKRGDTASGRSWIPRVNPILAAIDMNDLPIIQLLVERGAEVDHSRNHGINRSPLQRAAETGQIDVVRYLVTHGAQIDTRPMYSGGTALQLAAMNGYVGIAAFLLEHGADPNYPPAKGEGRSAFEAAAEWGRMDMMTWLMQAGVRLDMNVGDPPESQYDRAVRFAEGNGFPISKRYVQSLYKQFLQDTVSEKGLVY